MPKEVVGSLRWHVDIDSIGDAWFREVSGLDSESEVIEHRAVGKGGNFITYKIPGALKWSNIVLRRGVTDDKAFHDWRVLVEQGKVQDARKNGTITLYDPTNQAVARYVFKNGWPCKFKGPALDATKNEVAIEELEITHEGLERQE